MIKESINNIPEQVRLFLRGLAKARLTTNKEKEIAEKKTKISKSAIDSMIYHGKGGLNAWTILIAYLYNLSSSQVEQLLTESRELLRKRRKLNEIELKWSNLSEELSEDKKSFWYDLIRAMDPIYEIRKKKIRRTRRSKK